MKPTTNRVSHPVQLTRSKPGGSGFVIFFTTGLSIVLVVVELFDTAIVLVSGIVIVLGGLGVALATSFEALFLAVSGVLVTTIGGGEGSLRDDL